MPDDDVLRALVVRYAEAWGRGDREAWLDTFAPDATQEDPIGGGVRAGREDIGRFWDQAMSGYDQLTITPRAIHVVGGEAAMEWTIVAVSGNEETTFSGVDTFTFTAGEGADVDAAGAVPLIATVRAYWERSARITTTRPGR